MPNAERKDFTFARKIITAFLIALVFFIALFVLWSAPKILLIIFFGALLATFIRSISVPLARKTGVPVSLSSVIVIVVFCFFFYFIGRYLSPHVAVQARELAARLPDAYQRIQQQIQGTALGSEVLSHIPNVQDLMKNKAFLKEVTTFFSITFGVFSDLFIFLFIGLYLTFEPDVYIRGFLHLVPPQKKARAKDIIETIAMTLRRWLLGRFVSMAAVGVITGIGLWLLGVPLALTLGVLAALLTFIPYIGAVVSAVPAVLLALLATPLLALYVVALYLLAHGVEAYILTPIVQQRQVNLPPVFTLVAQILLGYAFGLLGLMLATPLAAIAVVLVKTLYVEDVLGEKLEVPKQPGKE